MFSKIALGVTALLSVAVVTVNGACDNGCSGHGTCGADDVCKCYPNWRMGDEDSGDCSDRVCPFELAWVDKPNKDGSFHNYAECAGRGLCNRGTGECECFEGYSGKACQRTTCPNDCSGHGTCEYIEELGFYSVHGDYFSGAAGSSGVPGSQSFGNRAVTFSNQEWDNHKTMGCVCDPKWTDVDCSRRMCPKGNDVLNTRLNVGDTLLYQKQEIFIPYLTLQYNAGDNDVIAHTLFEGAAAGGSDDASEGVGGAHFALTFISTLNETYTTKPIHIKETSAGSFASTAAIQDVDTTVTATNIETALKNLPHKVIDDVSVVCTEARAAGADMGLTITVEFTGEAVQGPQNLLQVEDLACDKGCYPFLPKGQAKALTAVNGIHTVGGMVPQTATWSTNNDHLPYVKQSQAADYNNYECGRRGKCNYGTGLCECFDGYTGESCNTQTALL